MLALNFACREDIENLRERRISSQSLERRSSFIHQMQSRLHDSNWEPDVGGAKGKLEVKIRHSNLHFLLAFCAVLGASSLAPSEARAQDSSPLQAPPSNDDSTPATDPVPTMFPHPESDRWWISGQANFISQWHPAFHSPYQGLRSLPPQAPHSWSAPANGPKRDRKRER